MIVDLCCLLLDLFAILMLVVVVDYWFVSDSVG